MKMKFIQVVVPFDQDFVLPEGYVLRGAVSINVNDMAKEVTSTLWLQEYDPEEMMIMQMMGDEDEDEDEDENPAPTPEPAPETPSGNAVEPPLTQREIMEIFAKNGASIVVNVINPEAAPTKAVEQDAEVVEDVKAYLRRKQGD